MPAQHSQRKKVHASSNARAAIDKNVPSIQHVTPMSPLVIQIEQPATIVRDGLPGTVNGARNMPGHRIDELLLTAVPGRFPGINEQGTIPLRFPHTCNIATLCKATDRFYRGRNRNRLKRGDFPTRLQIRLVAAIEQAGWPVTSRTHQPPQAAGKRLPGIIIGNNDSLPSDSGARQPCGKCRRIGQRVASTARRHGSREVTFKMQIVRAGHVALAVETFSLIWIPEGKTAVKYHTFNTGNQLLWLYNTLRH